MFCQNCGKEIPEGAAFCGNCGTKIGELSSDGVNEKPEQNNSQNAPENEDDEDEFENAYITGSVGTPTRTNSYIHYKNAFGKFKNGQKVNFNWCSFSLSIINMHWRKNYLVAYGYILAFIVDIMLTSGIISTFFAFASGLFCDYFTWSRYRSTLSMAKTMYPDNRDMQLSYVAYKGGTSTIGVIFGIIIAIIYSIIFIAATESQTY